MTTVALKDRVRLDKKERRQAKHRLAKKNYSLYLMLIPGVIFILAFRYMPMYGLVTAFQDYNIFQGIAASPWVGWEQFYKLFASPNFYHVLMNTLVISLGKILVSFPISILLAICINEIRGVLQKVFQTVLYLPHFLSWVIVAGLVVTILSPSSGVVNQIIRNSGGKPVSFLMDNSWFQTVLIGSETWKEVGYSAIVFIASIVGINPELYEAAKMDGAGRLKQILHVTLPGMQSIILLMFVLKLGGILNANTEQILLLYNPTVYATGDVLGSYIYRMGISDMNYSYAAAAGLFESIVGLVLVLSGNFISKKATGRSIW